MTSSKSGRDARHQSNVLEPESQSDSPERSSNRNNSAKASWLAYRHFSAASISAQDGALQRCTTSRSFWAARYAPPGEKLMSLNCPPFASSVINSCNPSTSQSLMASRPSLPATRRLSSGENATPWTPCKKLRNVATSRNVAVSNSRTNPLRLATAIEFAVRGDSHVPRLFDVQRPPGQRGDSRVAKSS